MLEIRICDDTDTKRVLPLCENFNLGIEVQGFYDPNLIDTPKVQELIEQHKELLSNFKKGKSLHGPFFDLNLGSKNIRIKEITLKTFNFAYEVAKSLGCTEIVVHNGFMPNTSYYTGWTKNAVEFWKEFFKDKDDSITMMIENQCEEDFEILKSEIDSVNDPRLKVCLDVGHAHANSNISCEEWITNLNDRIGYVHLHNNHGKVAGRPSFMNDEHFGLNNGTIDIPKVLSLLNQYCKNAIVSLECKLDEMEESLELLKTLNYIQEK